MSFQAGGRSPRGKKIHVGGPRQAWIGRRPVRRQPVGCHAPRTGRAPPLLYSPASSPDCWEVKNNATS
eukprot:3263778-Pyramimonas_sp.AAC.1